MVNGGEHLGGPPAAVSPKRRGECARRGERGYNFVALIILITLMNIALAVSLPKWSQVIKREKEEELIFRGLQYAEAIRVFRNRFNRLPTRLEELVEIQPRSIRQLWKDPMTADGKWGLVFEGQPLQPQTPGKDPEGDQGDDPDGRGDSGDKPGGLGLAPRKGETVAVGPIKGVYTLSSKESALLFNGEQRYNRWIFSVDLLGQGAGGGGQQAFGVGQGKIPGLVLSVRWLGRPTRPFMSTQPGVLPDGTPIPGGPGLPGFQPPVGQEPSKPQRRGGAPDTRK